MSEAIQPSSSPRARDARARSSSSAESKSPLAVPAPFRWTRRDAHTLPVHTRGTLPSWLGGQLVRTAPALFEHNGWHAAHWFDGLGLMYGFSFANGAASFRQRVLASREFAVTERGRAGHATFDTTLERGFFRRLFQPIPPFTDNANVNVVPWQGAWLAMTETPYQHVIDPDDLSSRGLYAYRDALGPKLAMSAHPHFDFAQNALVNVGSRFGPKTELIVLRQGANEHARHVEGTLAPRESPYLHDIGLTAKHVVIIDQPLRVRALDLLWSNRGYIEHFRWRPETGTRLWKLNRAHGTWTAYETEALFCFHVVNTFEDGEDTVFDFLAFDDPSIIAALRTEQILAGVLPTIMPRYVRARLKPGARKVELELLSDQGFDLPCIAYRAQHSQRYDTAWGVSLRPRDGQWQTEIVRVDHGRAEVRRFSEPSMIYGEPVFVPRPDASDPRDGVLLTVGSHAEDERASLAVLDAHSMEPLAHCDVELALPLGFHGNYRA